MKACVAVTTLLLATCAVARGAQGIVGTWVIAKSASPESRMFRGTTFTFRKDSRFFFVAPSVKGEGTYRLEGRTLLLTATKRNGIKAGPRERGGTAHVSADWKSIAVETGMSRNGKPITLLLIRA